MKQRIVLKLEIDTYNDLNRTRFLLEEFLKTYAGYLPGALDANFVEVRTRCCVVEE
jgi:hypothetical protein